jgi:hypothetical protein
MSRRSSGLPISLPADNLNCRDDAVMAAIERD